MEHIKALFLLAHDNTVLVFILVYGIFINAAVTQELGEIYEFDRFFIYYFTI